MADRGGAEGVVRGQVGTQGSRWGARGWGSGRAQEPRLKEEEP